MHSFALVTSYLNRSYQFSGELIIKNSIFGTAKYNSTIIYNWVREKFSANLMIPEKIRSYSQSRAGYDVHIIYDNQKPYFCLKASHPDTGVVGRFWTIEAEIICIDDKLVLGTKVSYSTPINSSADPAEIGIPRFIKTILNKSGMADIRKLGTSSWKVETESDVEKMYDLILNPRRILPVIIVSENNNVDGMNSSYSIGYLVDADYLAKEVAGIAHVVSLSSTAAEYWNTVVGRNWSVFGGAVRTYFPNVNFEDDSYMKHPLSIANRVMASYFIDKNGVEHIAGSAFLFKLKESMQKYNTETRIDWIGIGHKFYLIANREIIRNQESTLLNVDQLKRMYEEQISQLEEKIDNQETEILSSMLDMDQKNTELDEYKNIIYRLNLRVDALEQKFLQCKGGEADTLIPIYNDYSKLQNWVEEYFPGRVILHQRAIRSLKNAEYENPELVFKSILLLGTLYYQMRTTSSFSRNEFDEKCAELGIEEAPTIADTCAGEQGESYFVSHHGKKYKLESHIKKGSSRDPKYCMRIYFFWSNEDEQVVIGWLPQHLPISIS